MSDTEGSECEGCRWTRNEMARLRNELAKAGILERAIEWIVTFGDNAGPRSPYSVACEALKAYKGKETK